MQTVFIEATNRKDPSNPGINWGKFLVGRFTLDEWKHRSEVALRPGLLGWNISLLEAIGWSEKHHVFVMDLQTGEGAIFRHGGDAQADLEKHQILVCPLFEPFLTWLYKQDLSDLTKLPAQDEFTV